MIKTSGDASTSLYLKNILSEIFPEYCFSSDKNIDASVSIHSTDEYVECEVNINGKALSEKEYFARHQSRGLSVTTAIGRAVLNYGRTLQRKLPPYGVLIGVRPFKIASELISAYGDDASEILKERYLIDEDKIKLLTDTAKFDIAAKKRHDERDFSIYVSIPFCPSRCHYCSFISSTPLNMEITDKYVDALIEEMSLFLQITEKKGLRLRSVYIGGGTPTVLKKESLKKLMSFIASATDISSLAEYTVEAGRPDTVTEEKIEIIKSFAADRISVNCQTTNDKVLKTIGRNHTREDFFKAFETVRKYGFRTVNTDLIAGLRSETLESFKKSLSEVISLSPENLTVHTLALKKSAELKDSEMIELTSDSIDEGVKFAIDICISSGYSPYYLYKQKYSLGNHENVGYTKEGYESYYNIAMMNEIETILGFGAGATSRIVRRGYEKIEHLENYKHPAEYLKSNEKIVKNSEKINSLI